MIILLKIAFRNIIANKKRSISIGIAIFFSSLIMLIADSVMNGGEVQTLRGYLNIQSGNVAIVWEDVKKVSNTEAARLLDLNTFDINKNSQNRPAIERLNGFLEKHQGEIKHFFSSIRRRASLQVGSMLDWVQIENLTRGNTDLLINTETFKMDKGVLLSGTDYGICISREIANDNKLNVGDTVSISATTAYGARNMLDFIVTGIYANSAGYYNRLGFISDKNAKELYDFDPGFFDIGRIYLKNPDDSSKFAKELDKYLLVESQILRAESSADASAFYTTFSSNMKFINNLFIIFLLVMIAVGLRATIKMNLFERMKEFGTIRAIGFSRLQNYSIIFLEILFMSLISMLFSIIVSGIFIAIFSYTGIYTGPTFSYTFGGEVFYPKMAAGDVIFTLIIMIIFSLFSTFSPGMKICFQKITDLLLKRQRKVSLTGIIAKNIFSITIQRFFIKGARI